MRKVTWALALCLATAGCASEGEDEVQDITLEQGKDDGQAAGTLRTIASARNSLEGPSDLAFNPRVPDDLWVVNRDDDSTVIIHGASRNSGRRTEYRHDAYAVHFMANPMAIDFGADPTTFGVPGTMGTCGESRNTYGHTAPHNDFMGPVLWSTDLRIFARQDPYGLGSHIDMMHETPLCMGLAHEKANVFWAVGGLEAGIFRYDFMRDHGIGQDDHADGAVALYAKGQLRRVEGVPMHAVFDAGFVYVADSGNGRIVKLDTRSGRPGGALSPPEPLRGAVEMVGATLTEVVPARGALLDTPAGLALQNGQLWVSDHATGRISVFDLTGKRLRYYDTRLRNALGGLAFGPDGRLYVTDLASSRVLRLEPR